MIRDGWSRRTVLRSLAAGALVGCAPRTPAIVAATSAPPVPGPPPDQLVDAAGSAASFIATLEVPTAHGLLWRRSPDRADQLGTDLYHGSAGPVLFLVELFRATGDRRYLETATRGADHLIATLPTKAGPRQLGLYGGLAGTATVLHEVHAAGGDDRIAAAEQRVLELVTATVEADPALDSMTDILYGGAGVILWLLRVAADAPGSPALALATRLGDGLLGNARPAPRGQLWHMAKDAEYEMPNFSHGTAGVAFALARLHEASGHERFLASARAGAEHLLDIAHTDGGLCLIPHATDRPASAKRYYLGYCHGPAGTSRLFHQLHRVTGEATWADWYRRSVDSVVWSGVPESRTPGFWDNVGQCCGSAALVELLLDAAAITGDQDGALIELARRLATDVLDRGSPSTGGGTEWIHAENRVEPYWKQSFVGYMQGAAGIGSMLLRLAAHGTAAPWKTRLPDAPLAG